MIQRVLTQDLAQRLPSNGIVLPQEPAPSRHDAIVVDILQFDEDAGGRVIFDGSWSLTASDADKPLTRFERAASIEQLWRSGGSNGRRPRRAER
jgi:uncharacterized lipoprotein YmbA